MNARDISERKAHERKLGEQERRFRQITEHLPETVIWMTDLTFSTVRYVNPGYEDIWGRSADELYENPEAFLAGVHPDDREQVLSGMSRLLAVARDGEVPAVERIEYRVITPDEDVRWVHGRTVPLTSESGEVAWWVGIATDITDRKAREVELERYETLMRAVPDGVFIVDERGTMQAVNDAWAAMVGWERAELVGTSFDDLIEAGVIHEAVSDRYSEHLRKLLSSDSDLDHGAFRLKATLPGQDVPHTYEANVALLPYDEQFRGSAVVVRDVTERGSRP